MEENKPKRPRRTRAEIEAKVFDAIRQLADTKGLSNINFADICQYADVQPIVLNRNYETMEKLLDKYAYTCDYWLHDLFNSQHPTDQAGKDILKNTLQALAGHLYDNPDMQRLLTWELSADNEITRRMARSREMYYKAAIEEYQPDVCQYRHSYRHDSRTTRSRNVLSDSAPQTFHIRRGGLSEEREPGTPVQSTGLPVSCCIPVPRRT